MRFLFENAVIITKNQNDDVFSPGWLLIDGEEIQDLGAGNIPAHLVQGLSVINATGKIIMPGFINGHTHFSQAFLKGTHENFPLAKWLEKVIKPHQEKISIEQLAYAAQHSIHENIRYGTTTIIQHHKVVPSHEHIDCVLETAKRTGVRMAMMIGISDSRIHKTGFDSNIKQVINYSNDWTNKQFIIGFGPTSFMGCSKELLLSLKDAALDNNIPIHIHIAETVTERNESIIKYGESPIKWLNKIEFINKLTQLVHCIWVDDEEIDLIQKQGASVIHCPISNFYLRSNTTKICQIIERNIPLIIGTDGSGSSMSQNIIDNVKIATLVAKSSSLSDDKCTASYFLYSITKRAAEMLGRSDIGFLAPKKKADLVIMDTENFRLTPLNDPQIAVVFNSNCSDIIMVMIGGNVVFNNSDLLSKRKTPAH